MDKKTAEKISAEMQAAAREIAAKHGLSFSVMRGTYSATDYNFKGAFKDLAKPAVGSDGPAQTATLLSRAKLFAIDPSKKVISRGVTYTLVDYQDRARKYPWVGQDALGNKIRFPDETVRRHCAVAETA